MGQKAKKMFNSMKNKEEEKKHVQLLTIVHRITHRIISILELQKLLQATVTDIQKHLGYYNVTLLLLNKETNELGRQAMAGAYTELAPLDYHQKVGEGLIGFSAKSGKSLLVNDVKKDSRYMIGFGKAVPTRSELCVPIKLEGEVIAVLDIQEPKVNAFMKTDLKILETLGEQIAVAIKNAQWHEKLQKEIRERLQTEQALRESLEETLAQRNPSSDKKQPHHDLQYHQYGKKSSTWDRNRSHSLQHSKSNQGHWAHPSKFVQRERY